MWQFIVSGYIPGTDVQLTFDIFAMFIVSFLSVFITFIVIRRTLLETEKLVLSVQNFEEIAL
jgi:hypothetical protein